MKLVLFIYLFTFQYYFLNCILCNRSLKDMNSVFGLMSYNYTFSPRKEFLEYQSCINKVLNLIILILIILAKKINKDEYLEALFILVFDWMCKLNHRCHFSGSHRYINQPITSARVYVCKQIRNKGMTRIFILKCI